ncbi:MAG: MarR family transcriptional regulator, partial [Desulfovibrionaceae bacterium]|nr:MarR family transcriptional regulator [Desulfovibrionaceae bacterium]
ARSATLPDIRGGIHPDCRITTQGVFCEHGLSALQINVLALILRAGARVTPYSRITRQLAEEFGLVQTAESVRGVVNRLIVRGFIRRKQAREGTIRGVRYSPVDALICPHIIPVRADIRCGVRGDAHPDPYIGRHLLRLQQREEKRRLRREIGKRPRPGRKRFEDWLRDRGLSYQADQWRYRKALEALLEHLREAPSLPTDQNYDPVKAYAAHKQAILEGTPNLTPSHLDAYIALYMRNKGFTREVVLETIFRCAQEGQPMQPERGWRRYAERATASAFGIAGDMVLARGAASREREKLEQQELANEALQEEAIVETPRMRMR